MRKVFVSLINFIEFMFIYISSMIIADYFVPKIEKPFSFTAILKVSIYFISFFLIYFFVQKIKIIWSRYKKL